MRAWATGVSFASLTAGFIQVKGAHDLQASACDLPGHPVNGSITRLIQNQEWGTIAHFFAPSKMFIRMFSVYATTDWKPSAIRRIEK
jgi:hypothetical protein